MNYASCLFILYALRYTYCLTCADGSSAIMVARTDHRYLEDGSHCYNHCAVSNCTAVVLTDHLCVSLNINDFYGLIDARQFIYKKCILGSQNRSVVRIHPKSYLDYPSEKILPADDEYQCLSYCIYDKEFPCKSATFFSENGDCFMNKVTSTRASVLNYDGNSSATYVERKFLKEKKHCTNSFNMLPWNQMVIRGEAKLANVPGSFDKCLTLCGDCDYIIYNEHFAECFLVYYDHFGQKFNFVTEDYQVFENLCSQPHANCSEKNAMYIAYYNTNIKLRRQCLQKCIANRQCKYGYLVNSACMISAKEESYPILIEKQCVGFEELNVGILFEESANCPVNSNTTIEVRATELNDCMQLCLNHPTKSCEAISFFADGKCLLLSGTTNDSIPETTGCRHFRLNAIRFEGLPKRKGDAKKKQLRKSEHSPRRAKAHGVDKKNQITIRKDLFAEGAIELNVETICNYDSMVIKVTSPIPVVGKIFPRNAHESCSVNINGTEAELKMPLNSKHCSLTKKDLLYENVIVLKQNKLGDLPVITEYDQLYRVSCDYTNHTTKIAATSVLQLREKDYSTAISPSGKVSYSSLKMELRSKREKEAKTVILGQNVDLKIEDDRNLIGTNFTILNCVASGSNGDENITLIEDGCPTRIAKEYIVRGSIKKENGGFSIPLRAFRFKNGDGVKITCRLHACGQKCAQRTCSNKARNRRNVAEDSLDPDEFKEVEISLNVANEILVDKPFCVTRSGLIAFSTIGSFTIFLQFLLLLRIFQKHRKSMK